MDLVTILRVLTRHRIFVAGVFVLAIVAATAVKFQLPSLQSRSYNVGVATARILVDTPSSQVVAVAPKGSDTTAARADLLASLMIDGVVKEDIAQQAGLRPSQLIGVTNAATDQSPGSGAGTSGPSGRHGFVLTTQVLTNSSGDELPIIEVDTQAPTVAQATRLANASVAGLTEYLNSKAAAERIPGVDRLQVTGMGLPQADSVVRGPSGVIVVLVFVMTFVLGCAGILGVRGIVRGWRAGAAREQLGVDDRIEDAGELVGDSFIEDDHREVVSPRRVEPIRDVVPPRREVASPRREVASPRREVASPRREVVPPPPEAWLEEPESAKPREPRAGGSFTLLLREERSTRPGNKGDSDSHPIESDRAADSSPQRGVA